MSPTHFSTDRQIPDVRLSARESGRLRDRWMLAVPILISVVALYHLATCWNGPEPKPVGNETRRTIHVGRAISQVPTSTTESLLEPSLVPDDTPAFDPATPSWPYAAGWR